MKFHELVFSKKMYFLSGTFFLVWGLIACVFQSTKLEDFITIIFLYVLGIYTIESAPKEG